MPWRDATGLVVRGYRSNLDGSVQPYGLFVPPDWHPGAGPSRLLVWLAGRNDKRTELAFLGEREKTEPPFTPPNTLVVLPYGRFCNAPKFAGEKDVEEAMFAVRAQFAIDPLRIAVGGFSMGGASVWHLATHHSGLWCAATPGAGFAETAIYDKVFARGKTPPPWWEQKLWHWYNATDYAGNLFNLPLVAYSGEIDPQKQSADLMEKAMAGEGLKLERLIGPATAHKYEPKTKEILAARLNDLIDRGKPEVPDEVHLTTYTLEYPAAAWVEVTGLQRHWERADVRARRTADGVTVETKNVTALVLALPGLSAVTIDGETVGSAEPSGPVLALQRRDGKWAAGVPDNRLRKRPGLTGPIDDAMMDRFLFVRPTGAPLHPKVGAWTGAELAHAIKMWRDIFRGEAPVKNDAEVTAEDIRDCNLVLWGDPSSNRLIAQILGRLPLHWNGEKVGYRGKDYDAADHVPILIYPNPLNPKRYVVLNSGMDFRDEAYGTNAEQTPKLPDWVTVDLRTRPGPRWPGRIEEAGFFDEQWQLSALSSSP